MPGLRDSCASLDQHTQSWLGGLARARAAVAWQREAQPGSGVTEAGALFWRPMVRAEATSARVLPSSWVHYVTAWVRAGI